MVADIILIEPDLRDALRARLVLNGLPSGPQVHHLNGITDLPQLLKLVRPCAAVIDCIGAGRWGVLDVARVRITLPVGANAGCPAHFAKASLIPQ